MEIIKKRPIIFNTEMVKALIDGRKTQTRRVIKPQPIWHPKKRFWSLNQIVKGQSFTWEEDLIPNAPIKYCPYGKIGDRLWVRETWAIDEDEQTVIFYKATDHETCGQPWKPSIFMPRWASRITLEITDIRIERVQDIKDEQAIFEGCPGIITTVAHKEACRGWFKHLWDSINAKRGYGWIINPWVWIIVFKVLRKELL